MPSFSSDEVNPFSPILTSPLPPPSESAGIAPSRLQFGRDAPSSSSSSSDVPQHNEDRFHFTKAFQHREILMSDGRQSLDGSFRVLTPTTSSAIPALDGVRLRNPSLTGAFNSTPLDPDCSPFSPTNSVASPIFRERDRESVPNNNTRARAVVGRTGSPTWLSRSALRSGEASIHNDDSGNEHGSQLAKQIVINHSYIPPQRDPPPNPLGIKPRRPLNHRSKDLTFSLRSSRIFSLSRAQSLLSPVINRVVETMSPRKRRSTRAFKAQRRRPEQEIEPKPEIVPEGEVSTDSTCSGVAFLSCAFLTCLGLLYYLYTITPQLTEEERQLVKFPRSIEDAKDLGNVLNNYKDDHYGSIVLGFFAIYNFLQTFAIPGSIFLSILSGFLFPFPLACFLVCLCSALGASFCYLLSSVVGKPLIIRWKRQQVEDWRNQVDRQRQNLLSYIIFLRITPFLPNWFINIVSPIIGVPLLHFFVGTFLGVAPPSFVYISAGQTLHQLTSSSSILTWHHITILALLALLSVLPVFLKEKLKNLYT